MNTRISPVPALIVVLIITLLAVSMCSPVTFTLKARASFISRSVESGAATTPVK